MFRVPRATYRLQFNAQFTFQDARRIVPYLAQLGISDVYASPILRARTGSTHGYDIVDADRLNPELGTEDDFTELTGELDRLDMGLVLDIVPNHMGASHENAWWMSVLENGPQSRFVHYFDIDWRDNKVLLPVLGRPYGDTLSASEIRLGFDVDGFFFCYYDKRLPLAPQSYPLIIRECVDAVPAEGVGVEVRDLAHNEDVVSNSRFLKETLWRLHEQSDAFREAIAAAVERINGDVDRLDQLLTAQWYRLAYWRIASETINYRRFFDVTDLVGLRIENPEVFEARNRRILDLITERKVTGLRVDHIDGLHDPVNYLTKLQLRLGDPATEEPEQTYVIVEKILEHGEILPSTFRVAGTTGYDFLDTANALFVDPDGLRQLTKFYGAYTGHTAPFEEVVYERKKQVIEQLFVGEMRALGLHLAALAVADRNARDFAPSELLAALIEITACLPVYRTYIREGQPSKTDCDVIRAAIAKARQHAENHVDPQCFRFVEAVLQLEPPPYIANERERWSEFVMRWQQFTGRVMAKGVEDTAFYNYNRLVSLNEVGGEPGRTDFDPVAELHARNERIARDWPHTMNATSTHDTKRSEDVRARINVLSEIPDAWRSAVRKWTRMNAALKRNGIPHPNEELLIYQTLAGMWPLDEAAMATVPERLRAYLEKAAREAKTHTSWLAPDQAYESALRDFASAILEHEPFIASFRSFHRRIAFHGMLNSLAQLVVKATSPGTPDFYQGTELWDFSLVDPDNRRPVDFDRRAALLAKLPPPATLLRHWKDGRIKLFTTARTLAVRARHADTFRSGRYRAVDTATPHAVAFTRGDDVLVMIPRLTAQLPRVDAWPDRSLDISGRWKHAFTDELIEGVTLRNVFASFPVAILERA